MRPQAPLGTQLRAPDTRPIYGVIKSVGAGTVYVLYEGGGNPKRMVCVGGTPVIGMRVEIVDRGGVPEARIPS